MHDFFLRLSWIKTKLKIKVLQAMFATNSTIEDVAAAVQRQPELVRALDESAAAQARQKHLHVEMATLNRKRDKLLTAPDAAAIETRLQSINAELRNVEKLRLAATQKIQHHQPAYAEAVRAALAQHRREVAARVATSIAELVKAASELDATAKAIEAAGGRVRRLPPVIYIESIAAVARKIESEFVEVAAK